MSSPINVNLLSGRAYEIKQERSIKAKVQFVSAFILICFLGLLMVVLGLSTFVNVKLNQIKAQAKIQEERIEQLAYVEDTYLLLQNKVALLEDFFSLDQDILDALEGVIAEMPDEVVISDFELDNENLRLTLTLTAPTYELLNSFTDFAMSNIDQGKFSKIDFEGITRDENGIYVAKIIMTDQNNESL